MFRKVEYENLTGWVDEQEKHDEIITVDVYCDKDHSISVSNLSTFLKLGLVSLFAILLI